ncbi:solute:sodium symporter family transporter [bacterium]|nr:solute:sodium symporter family transporter [bacterium]
MGIVDIIIFFAFIACVMVVSLWKSGGEAGKSADDYFLAGRGLSWWLIGFSLIAANISAEQFVGMSGQGAGAEGLSCASWEWIAAIALVVVAFALLPYFLRSGITTIPEFLEIRYNHWARAFMTVSMMGILIVASLIGVTYAGSLVMQQLFQHLGWNLPFWSCCLIMGCLAGVYVMVGGLKACAWADLLQGSALIVGGAVIAYFAMKALGSAAPETLTGAKDAVTSASAGAIERFRELNEAKLHMGREATDAAMPWTILIIGIWIPNFYYWGLNQYITQRILGSGSLAEGQKGIVLAAFLKLIIPFVIVIPGIIAFNLFAKDLAAKPDEALGLLITRLIPQGVGLMGFVLAALLGAIVSSLAAVLNATSTLFTMDIYQRYMRPSASQKEIVLFGRLTIVVLLVIGIVVASFLNAQSIFAYIQKMQLYVSPGIVAVFIFGLVNRRGARWIGALALLLSPIIYYLLSTFGWSLLPGAASFVPEVCGCVVIDGVVQPMHYLWAASYNLIITLVIMFVLGAIFKMEEPISFESSTKLDMKPSTAALVFGVIVVVLTVALYVYFW